MGKTGRRIWYGVAMFLCGLVLLLNVAGIAGVWIAERALSNTVVQVIAAVDHVTESLRQATQRVDDRLERMQAVSTFISTASARVSQKVTDEGVLRLLLPDEKEQNLAQLSGSVRESISPLRDSLTAGLTFYRTINQLPFVNLPTPDDDHVDRVEEAVGEVQTAADRLETEITDFRSGTSNQIERLETGANALTERIGQSRDRLAQLDTRLAVAQESLDDLQQTALRLLVIVAIVLTLMLAWVGYTQVELMRVYRQRWKAAGSAGKPEMLPAPAAETAAEAVIEADSPSPELPSAPVEPAVSETLVAPVVLAPVDPSNGEVKDEA